MNVRRNDVVATTTGLTYRVVSTGTNQRGKAAVVGAPMSGKGPNRSLLVDNLTMVASAAKVAKVAKAAEAAKVAKAAEAAKAAARAAAAGRKAEALEKARQGKVAKGNIAAVAARKAAVTSAAIVSAAAEKKASKAEAKAAAARAEADEAHHNHNRAAAASKADDAKLSTDQKAIPTDPAKLRALIKITRDRRWRAGRRGDEALAEEMNAKLTKLLRAQKRQAKAASKGNDTK